MRDEPCAGDEDPGSFLVVCDFFGFLDEAVDMDDSKDEFGAYQPRRRKYMKRRLQVDRMNVMVKPIP